MAAKPITTRGAAVLSTTQKKFGSTSLKITTATADLLSTLDSADFAYGSGDFTIDFWAYCFDWTGFNYILGQVQDSSNFNGVNLKRDSAAGGFGSANSGAGSGWDLNATVPSGLFTDNTWHHIEIGRSGNTWYFFVDGVSKTVTAALGSFSAAWKDMAGLLYIGGNPSGFYGNHFTGYIDELRISKGVCRHTAGFTPPSSAYTTDAFTVLLMHFEGSNGDTLMKDDSDTTDLNTTIKGYWKMDGNSNDSVGSANGTDSNISYSTGKISNAAFFNGSSSKITGSIAQPVGAYTVAMWIKDGGISIADTNYRLWDTQESNVSTSNGAVFAYNPSLSGSTRNLRVYHNNGSWVSSNNLGTTLNDGNWHHVVAAWDGVTMTFYVDGVAVGGGTYTTTITNAGHFDIGHGRATATWWNGGIDEVGLWERCLTATEVASLYNSGSGKTYPFTNTITSTLSETITHTDTVLKMVSRTLTESVTLTASMIRNIVRTLSETITHTDTVLKVKVQFKLLTETLSHTDTIIRSLARTLTETITHSDTFQRTLVLFRTLTETLTNTDTVLKQAGRTLSEVVTMTDTFIKTVSRTLTETVTLTGTMIRDVVRTLTETITHTDTFITLRGRTLYETLTHTDIFNAVITVFGLIRKGFIKAIKSGEAGQAGTRGTSIKAIKSNDAGIVGKRDQ